MRIGCEHWAVFLWIHAAVGPVMMEGGMGWLPDEFLGSETQQMTRGRVYEYRAPLGVHTEDPFSCGFEDESRSFFAELNPFTLLPRLSQQFLSAEITLQNFQAH